jgi:hypothetical protein
VDYLETAENCQWFKTKVYRDRKIIEKTVTRLEMTFICGR